MEEQAGMPVRCFEDEVCRFNNFRFLNPLINIPLRLGVLVTSLASHALAVNNDVSVMRMVSYIGMHNSGVHPTIGIAQKNRSYFNKTSRAEKGIADDSLKVRLFIAAAGLH